MLEESSVQYSSSSRKNWTKILIGIFGICILSLTGLFIAYKRTEKQPATQNTKESSSSNASTNNLISLATLTPAASGSPFEKPILDTKNGIATYTVNGRIVDILDLDNNGGKNLVVSNYDGRLIKEPVLAEKNTRVILSTYQNGKNVESEITLSDISKGDHAYVSYNLDLKTKKWLITGIRIER